MCAPITAQNQVLKLQFCKITNLADTDPVLRSAQFNMAYNIFCRLFVVEQEDRSWISRFSGPQMSQQNVETTAEIGEHNVLRVTWVDSAE